MVATTSADASATPPVGSGRAALGVVVAFRRLAAGFGTVAPHRAKVRWHELASKLEAYELFRRAPRIGRDGAIPLPPAVAVERARNLGPYRSLWSIEGLGFWHAECLAEQGENAGAVWNRLAAAVPPAAAVPWTCGIGMSLAQRCLARLTRRSRSEQRSLEDLLAAVGAVSDPAAIRIVSEALGFLARVRWPRNVENLAARLGEIDAALLACFAHGGGRGIYLSPRFAPPWSSAPWGAVTALEREPWPSGSRDAARRGLAWAITAINLRHPQVVAEFFRHHGQGSAATAAFASGVRGALRTWSEVAPDDPFVDGWRSYRPDPRDVALGEIWHRQMTENEEAGEEPRGLFLGFDAVGI